MCFIRNIKQEKGFSESKESFFNGSNSSLLLGKTLKRIFIDYNMPKNYHLQFKSLKYSSLFLGENTKQEQWKRCLCVNRFLLEKSVEACEGHCVLKPGSWLSKDWVQNSKGGGWSAEHGFFLLLKPVTQSHLTLLSRADGRTLGYPFLCVCDLDPFPSVLFCAVHFLGGKRGLRLSCLQDCLWTRPRVTPDSAKWLFYTCNVISKLRELKILLI